MSLERGNKSQKMLKKTTKIIEQVQKEQSLRDSSQAVFINLDEETHKMMP